MYPKNLSENNSVTYENVFSKRLTKSIFFLELGLSNLRFYIEIFEAADLESRWLKWLTVISKIKETSLHFKPK